MSKQNQYDYNEQQKQIPYVQSLSVHNSSSKLI